MQSALQSFTDEQKEVVWLCVRKSFDKAIHTFLFKLQEQADFEIDIQILVDGKNIVEESEALHWELFGEDGWLAKYNTFGEPSEYQLDEREVEDTLNG